MWLLPRDHQSTDEAAFLAMAMHLNTTTAPAPIAVQQTAQAAAVFVAMSSKDIHPLLVGMACQHRCSARQLQVQVTQR
jgi:hypothetical protein